MSLTSSPSARPEQVGMRTLTDTVWELQQVPLLQCKWKTGDVQAKGSLWGSTLEIQAHQGWSSMCFAVPIGFIPTKDPRCLAAPGAAPLLRTPLATGTQSCPIPSCLRSTVVLYWRITHFLWLCKGQLGVALCTVSGSGVSMNSLPSHSDLWGQGALKWEYLAYRTATPRCNP